MRRRTMQPLLLVLLCMGMGAVDGQFFVFTAYVSKCCARWEMLTGDGRSCVESPSRYRRTTTTTTQDPSESGGIRVIRLDTLNWPFDVEESRPWFPPGRHYDDIVEVNFNGLRDFSSYQQPIVLSVNASGAWNETAEFDDDYWAGRIVFDTPSAIMRPKRGGGARRTVLSCFDEAAPPLGPFALIVRKWCEPGDCIRKCCASGSVLDARGGAWRCVRDRRGYWSPFNSTFTRFIDPETPFLLKNDAGGAPASCPAGGEARALRLSAGDESSAAAIRRTFETKDFPPSACVDFERRGEEGALAETLLTCNLENGGVADSRNSCGLPLPLQSALFLISVILIIR